jgi:hypothetical protein
VRILPWLHVLLLSYADIPPSLRILKVTGGREAFARPSDPPSNHASIKLKDKGYIPGSFVLECFFIHFDGHQYGPVNETFTISKFYGLRELESLPVVPLECDPKKDQILRDLLSRGRKFVKLSNPREAAHKKYCGLTLDTRQDQVNSMTRRLLEQGPCANVIPIMCRLIRT